MSEGAWQLVLAGAAVVCAAAGCTMRPGSGVEAECVDSVDGCASGDAALVCVCLPLFRAECDGAHPLGLETAVLRLTPFPGSTIVRNTDS